MAFFNKIKTVVQTEGARGIRQALQKEGTKRFAQDLSAHLAVDNLNFCETRRYGLPALISAIAVDPVQGLLASGTFKGTIAVTGATEQTCYLELEEAVSVKMIAFQPGSPVLIVIDAKNAITVFDLIKKRRLFVRNARSVVTCMELIPGTNWLFHGLRDGSIDVFDVYRGQAVPYRIPNLIPEGSRHSLVVSIQAHPKDNNQLLIAYSTGIALWNLKQKSVTRTFIFEIPPGAMGGITADPGNANMHQSRYPQVTVISWKPDGLGFVSGYDDGCFVFWDIHQEHPLLARTIHEIQVNVPGIRPVFERDAAQFVPLYRLQWCLHKNLEDTTLIVAGGTSSIDMFGLHLFDFPAKADYRSPRRHQTLTMDSDILDFVVLPKSSPWYNGGLDPVSILVLTNRGGIRSFGFDPAHSVQAIPSCLSMVEPRLLLAKTYAYGHLPQDQFHRLLHGLQDHRSAARTPRIPLRGIQLATISEEKLCRDLLVTAHADCSIRFWEGASFRPLHHLTVELGSLFFKDQASIVAFDYSIPSQVLAVGFSNGHWVYGRLSNGADFSRQSSISGSVPGSANVSRQSSITGQAAPLPVAVATETELARAMRDSLTLDRIDEGDPTHSEGWGLTAPAVPNQPQRSLQQDMPPPRAPTPSPPGSDGASPVAEPAFSKNEAPPQSARSPQEIATSETDPKISVNTGGNSGDTLSPPTEDLDYLVPCSPASPVALKELAPPLPDRTPSPSLPARPLFIESNLMNDSEFSPVFKSTSHLGKINCMTISACGLVAVSDEFYTLSISDTRTQRVLHVEDLKVVMLDRENVVSQSEGAQGNNKPQLNALSPTEVQALQRVGVVISTLQFVFSTTSEQDKVQSLLLIAGSTEGIYMIFTITPPEGLLQPRRVRKVETFQTKECYASVHTSIINVLSPSEAAAKNAAAQSASSLSSVSTAATSNSTSASSSSLPAGSPPPPPPREPLTVRYPNDDLPGTHPGHSASLSESSASIRSENNSKPSIYSTLREAQDKVMSKAQQRLNYLVSVSEHGIRLHMNCTSRRIQKIDLSAHDAESLYGVSTQRTGRIMAANVVYHEGACCILCLTESGRVLLFSVPKLELIPLPIPNGGELMLPIVLESWRLRESVIMQDGRIFVPILKFEYRMYSLWGHDRWIPTSSGWRQETMPSVSGPARAGDAAEVSYLQVYDHSVVIPPRPTNATVVSRGWFGSSQTVEEPLSPQDLDVLLGGEHYQSVNPVLKRAGVQGPPGVAPPPPPKLTSSSGGGGGSAGIAGMMNQTMQGLDERGKRLGQLGDKTAEMESASHDFLAAARELNAKNANKKWYEF
ncbi:hypothetical protein EMPS_09380 [Entomortierella parvispora]|uniref:V-SNARE coiled-coil homology domain-containing protein n=1 Tax=Entomortierella parvispora TaxID=205924 RepID=A0A9P3LZZ5_9FUNG|nr:hypothetical protein EMPS_09380 [Entomortierella parvispora]